MQYQTATNASGQKRLVDNYQALKSNEDFSHYESGETIGLKKDTAKTPCSPLTHFRREHSQDSHHSTVMSLALDGVHKPQEAENPPVISAERVIDPETLRSQEDDGPAWPRKVRSPAVDNVFKSKDEGTMHAVTEN